MKASAEKRIVTTSTVTTKTTIELDETQLSRILLAHFSAPSGAIVRYTSTSYGDFEGAEISWSVTSEATTEGAP